jgi:hypothetical protein
MTDEISFSNSTQDFAKRPGWDMTAAVSIDAMVMLAAKS